MTMSVDFREYCTHLRSLGREKPSAARRRELEEGLASKIDGVVVCAAHGLCGWGDRPSIDAVRRRLEDYIGLPRRESTVAGILNALAPVLREEEYDWAIGLYDRYSQTSRYAFWPFFDALPTDGLHHALDRCRTRRDISDRTTADLRERRMWREIGGKR